MPYITHTSSDNYDSTSADLSPFSGDVFSSLFTDHDPEAEYGDSTATEAWMLSATVEIGETEAVLSVDLAETTDSEGEVQVALRRDAETGKVHLVVSGEHAGLVVEEACSGVFTLG